MATAAQRAWYLGTAAAWQHNAAANARDHSAAAIQARLQALMDGDLGMRWQGGGSSSMRLWARFQSLSLSGNPLQRDGTDLKYEGDSTGIYLGGDARISESLRLGLALGTDDADITLDLDDDGLDDAAMRSATSIYPYMRLDLGHGNEARLMAGFGNGTLDIRSTANNNAMASTDLSWSMLAASLSHDRVIEGPLQLRVGSNLQLGTSDSDAAAFASGATLMAGESSSGELAFSAELRYQRTCHKPPRQPRRPQMVRRSQAGHGLRLRAWHRPECRPHNHAPCHHPPDQRHRPQTPQRLPGSGHHPRPLRPVRIPGQQL